MSSAGTLADQFAVGAGFLAAAIAVGGFIFHAGPVLSGSSEADLRQLTVLGGLAGLAAAISVVVLSAIID